jgi:hypothetical protein
MFLFQPEIPPCHVAPCHHSMARRQVTDGGEALQFWSVAANIKEAVADSRQRVVLQLGGWARG